MKTKLLFVFIVIFNIVNAQNFINGDLEGIVTGDSQLPPNWQKVPFTDINCHASQSGYDTPDLTNIYGPDAISGILGNPYSGSTFVSGVYSRDTNYFFQEGIMQNVSGFNINQVYVIRFYQSVVKQYNCLDESGSWAVYVDSVLIGITIPTYSTAPFNSTSFIWELENIEFTATSTSHTIKFLPIDNDTNNIASQYEPNGALRMGIDNISINLVNRINEVYNSTSVSVFPNPGHEQMIIEFNNQNKDNYTLTLYDNQGRLLRIINNITSNKVELKRENLLSGIYFFRLQAYKHINTIGKLKIE